MKLLHLAVLPPISLKNSKQVCLGAATGQLRKVRVSCVWKEPALYLNLNILELNKRTL